MALKRKHSKEASSSMAEENPLIGLYAKRGGSRKRDPSLMSVTSEHLKWGKIRKAAKACFNIRLAKLQRKEIAVPKLIDWSLFKKYKIDQGIERFLDVSTEDDDGNIFEDYCLESALNIKEEEIYKEWCLEFFSTNYFNQEADLDNNVKKKCIWFHLCGQDHVMTLTEFAQLLDLYDEVDIADPGFTTHFARLERECPKYDGKHVWNVIGDPNSPRPKVVEIHHPLSRLMNKILVNAFVHHGNSQDKAYGPDLWLIEMITSSFEGKKFKLNVAWTLATYLSKRAALVTEHGYINGGNYVSKIGRSLGYVTPEELSKITLIKKCEVLDKKSLTGLLDHDKKQMVETLANVVRNPVPPPPPQTGEPSGLESGWGEWNANLPQVERREVWRDLTMMRFGHQMDYCAPILTHLGQQSLPLYSFPMTYDPPSVPPYPYPYTPYPLQHVPYLTASSAFQGSEGYNVHHEGFMGYYSSDVGPNFQSGYEAGTSSAVVGMGALVDYGGDDEYDNMDDE